MIIGHIKIFRLIRCSHRIVQAIDQLIEAGGDTCTYIINAAPGRKRLYCCLDDILYIYMVPFLLSILKYPGPFSLFYLIPKMIYHGSCPAFVSLIRAKNIEIA